MSNGNSGVHQREIFTKAVCGKGRKFLTAVHRLVPSIQPDSVLGAWIINPKFEAFREPQGIEISGSYDVNVWYSHGDSKETDVAKEKVTFKEIVPLSYCDQNREKTSEEVKAWALREPQCVEATIDSDGSGIILHVEQEYRVELLAETKVCVVVADCADDGLVDKGYEFDSPDAADYEELDPDLFEDEVDSDEMV